MEAFEKLAQTHEVSTLSMMLGPEQNGVSHQEKEPVGTIMCDGCSGPGGGCWAAVFLDAMHVGTTGTDLSFSYSKSEGVAATE